MLVMQTRKLTHTHKKYSILYLLTFLFFVSRVLYVNYQSTELHQDTHNAHAHAQLFDKFQRKISGKKMLCMHQPSEYYTLYTPNYFLLSFMYGFYHVNTVLRESQSHCLIHTPIHSMTWCNICQYLFDNKSNLNAKIPNYSTPAVYLSVCMRARANV